tara:strand:- start:598 stop:1752 length:1155 start_codon:yes stop_codon:yes gene_type:complete
VSQAFDIPKLTYDNLHESSYTIPATVNHTIYEMICKQELIRKELVESKNNFDIVWLNNEKISNLASLVYEQDETVIAKALVESICEVPYLALATKKQITDTITNNLELNESIKVNIKDIKAYSSLLFEYKKPLKSLFISMLNEKYGISVQNLKDIPTFKSLLNTQVLIFEALAKLSPKGSIAKEILTENSQMLKTKNGVECIDVNHFIELLFERSGYSDVLENDPLVDVISIKETFSEMDSVEELVDMILEKTKAKKPKKKGSFPDLNKDGELTKADILVGRGVIKAETEVEEEEPRVEEEEVAQVEAPEQEKADESPPEEEKEDIEEKTKDAPTSDEIMASFKSFEDILNSIDFESLEGDEEEEDAEGSEEEAEVDTKEEGEE